MVNRNEYSKRKIPIDMDEKKPLKFSVLKLLEQINCKVLDCEIANLVFLNDPIHLWLVH